MASSPDLSGNELSRDRSSRNDHGPQVPAARLTVCQPSYLWLFDRVVTSDHFEAATDTLFNEISLIRRERDVAYSKLNTSLKFEQQKPDGSQVIELGAMILPAEPIANKNAAETWLQENNPESGTFEYGVEDSSKILSAARDDGCLEQNSQTLQSPNRQHHRT